MHPTHRSYRCRSLCRAGRALLRLGGVFSFLRQVIPKGYVGEIQQVSPPHFLYAALLRLSAPPLYKVALPLVALLEQIGVRSVVCADPILGAVVPRYLDSGT